MTLEYVLNEVFVNLNCYILNATLNFIGFLAFYLLLGHMTSNTMLPAGQQVKNCCPPKQNAEKAKRNAVEIIR